MTTTYPNHLQGSGDGAADLLTGLNAIHVPNYLIMAL